MQFLDAGFFLIAAPAVVFAGISKGGFGSGAAFASASILALVLEPGQALAIMLPLLMLIDVASLKPYWNKWSFPDASVVILGALPGVVLAAMFFRAADPDLLRLLIGGISIGFAVWQVVRARALAGVARHSLPVWAGAFAGLVAGFTSFVSHAGGPPAAVFLLSRNLTKTRYQASTVLIFWVINILKFFPYALLGLFTAQTVFADFLLAPFALLGTWLGVRAHGMVSERLFFGLTYILLILTGSKLVWDGLT